MRKLIYVVASHPWSGVVWHATNVVKSKREGFVFRGKSSSTVEASFLLSRVACGLARPFTDILNEHTEMAMLCTAV